MVRLKPLVSIDTETGKVQFMDKLPDGAVVVVMPFSIPLLLPDNLVGNCSVCGAAVQFRPENIDAPFKLCFPCAPDFMAGAENPS